MTQQPEALNIAGQCRATASSPLSKNIAVDGGGGLLCELLLDAAKAIESLAAQPEHEPVTVAIEHCLSARNERTPCPHTVSTPAAVMEDLKWAVSELEALDDATVQFVLDVLRKHLVAGSFTPAQPAIKREWIAVDERMPKPGAYVLAVFRYPSGKQRVIRAMHAPRHTLSEDDYGEFVTEGADYDEATDITYWQEGWYECNENEETHWHVSEKVTHWMPLPDAPADHGIREKNT
jgi:hypothetical protein